MPATTFVTDTTLMGVRHCAASPSQNAAAEMPTTKTIWTPREMAMDTEEQQPKPRERKMSKSFEVALRYDAIAQHRGPSKAIRKRAKGPKAIAAITNRLQRAAAKRAKAMALE